ncbi:MAG: 4'-phosphopantetheinyl transferase superfamily protein [Bacteroidia bacterium]|nr:4'-phosphopantetheinyl transferase superfamily protein [Bacteroidia bacterium]
MPYIYKIHHADVILGLWRITENASELVTQIQLNEEENNQFTKFMNNRRRTEWLSTRLLLKELLGPDKVIIYDETGKPYLKDNSYKISITHTKGLSAVIISRKYNVGIDAECLSDRIQRIVSKFISDDEMKALYKQNQILHLYLHWCAKEALVKLLGKKNLVFDKDIQIQPFMPEDKGAFHAKINIENIYSEYCLNYFIFENYVIVYSYISILG